MYVMALKAATLIYPLASAALNAGYKYLTKQPDYMAKRTAQRQVSRPRYVKPRRSMRVPRSISDTRIVSMHRTTDIAGFTVAAGTIYQGYYDVVLNSCYVSDLLTAYDVYRIKKVTWVLTPRVDAGNNGVVNNYNAHVYCANDGNGVQMTTANTQIASFHNYKYGTLKSGESFYYSFYPKCLNTIDNNGTSKAVGNYGKFNPWINLDSNGILIPHKRLLFNVNAGGTTTLNFEYTLTIHFDVLRQK